MNGVNCRGRATDARSVIVTMPEEVCHAGEVAAGAVPYHLNHAAALFDLIHTGISGGWLDRESQLLPLAEICAVAFRHIAETHGEALARLQRPLMEPGATVDAADMAARLTGLAEAAEAEGDADQAARLRRQAANWGAGHGA